MAVGAKGAILLRILCAFALFMLGLAGDAFADPSQDPHSAQYRLPDGTYASLCQPGDTKGGAPHNGANHCGGCVTAAGHAFTPPAGYAVARPGSRAGETFGFAEIANVKRIRSHHNQGRGPPLSA